MSSTEPVLLRALLGQVRDFRGGQLGYEVSGDFIRVGHSAPGRRRNLGRGGEAFRRAEAFRPAPPAPIRSSALTAGGMLLM